MSDARAPRTGMGVLALLMAYWGYVDALNGAAAPFLAREFGLDAAGIAWALVLGGLGPAVSVLGLLMIPAALVFLAFVPETTGLALEAAALEDEQPGTCQPPATRAELAGDD